MFIDSHVHLSSPELFAQADLLLQKAALARVSHVINICTDPESLRQGLALAARYPCIKNAGATTPHDVEREGSEAFPLFEQAAFEKTICAVGETGLDYHYERSSKEEQRRFLIRYLHLAQAARLPVIFHCRGAFPDLFSIADGEYAGPAVLHCFTGTEREAEEVLSRGWHLSLSGIVTFKKSQALREVAKMVPLAQLLIETDAPYLAPQSHRGEQNEPSFLPEIAQCVADAKGISIEEAAGAASQNARRVFAIEAGA